MRSKCRLLAVDIDGTLLDGSGKVTARVRGALLRAHAGGMTIVLATGRRFRSSLPVAREIGVTDYIIAQHGTIIKRVSDAETVWAAPMRRPTARKVAEVMMRHGLEPLVFSDAYETGVDFVVASGKPARPGTCEFTGIHRNAWRAGSFADVAGAARIVEVGAFDDTDRLRAAYEEIERLWGDRLNYHVIKSPNYSFHCVEVISRRAGKGNALLALGRILGVRREETAAIGDDVNDIDLLSKAGTGIAMGNAAEAIKAKAHFVVGPNTADGLAEAVERLLRQFGDRHSSTCGLR